MSEEAKEPTLLSIRQDKSELEGLIKGMLEKFQEKYKVKIDDVKIGMNNQTFSGLPSFCIDIKIKI